MLASSSLDWKPLASARSDLRSFTCDRCHCGMEHAVMA